MQLLRTFGSGALAAIIAMGVSATALAKPDHRPPGGDHGGVEDDDGVDPGSSDCDGLSGGARGLCNAYCDAQDCPSHPDKHSCAVLRANFERQTGQSQLPCDADEVTTATASPTRTATEVPPSRTPTDTPESTATSTAATPTATGQSATATITARTGTATSTAATGTATATPVTTVTAVKTETPAGAPTATATADRHPCRELSGGAAGLCNAFCNAQHCPSHPEKHSCDVLRANFTALTGSDTFPCETGVPTATPTGIGTATPGSDDGCMGDCSGDGEVDISDLTQCMLIVLGQRDAAECVHVRHDGRMRIGDVVLAVRHALDGCR